MRKLSIAYFGSPDFAANFLEKIVTDPELSTLIETNLVITQSDQPVGRKQILTPTPVKIIAKNYNLNIQSSLLREKMSQIDLALVYAYGDLIPKELLDQPKYGFWNIHPSLLPKYRGPSPIATPLINGDKITGVTIIKMDEEIDHGPIISQEKLMIDQNNRRPDLEKKLTDLGFEMLKKIIKNSLNSLNSLNTKIQNDKEATFTKKLSKQDGFIEISKLKDQISNNSKELFNLFRGLYPWPGIWTMIKPIQPTRLDEAKRLKITDLSLINGKLIIKKVQLEGKNEVSFKTFNKAYNIL